MKKDSRKYNIYHGVMADGYCLQLSHLLSCFRYTGFLFPLLHLPENYSKHRLIICRIIRHWKAISF